MIGYDIGGAAAAQVNPTSVRDTVESLWEWGVDRVQDLFEPVWAWVETAFDVATWVLERIAQVFPVIHEHWYTAADERVCPECGPLAGQSWEAGDGPYPPLHDHCRCQRDYAFTEWRTRFVSEWRLHWSTQSRWDWVQR